MFVGKAISLSLSGAHESLRAGSCQHWIRLEGTTRNKHSSLLQTFVNYGHKKFFFIKFRPKRQHRSKDSRRESARSSSCPLASPKERDEYILANLG